MAGIAGKRIKQPADDLITVELLTRAGCGLCDEANDLLFELSIELPLAQITTDIGGDASLEAAYGERIPVIRFASGRELVAPIDRASLRAALAAEAAL